MVATIVKKFVAATKKFIVVNSSSIIWLCYALVLHEKEMQLIGMEFYIFLLDKNIIALKLCFIIYNLLALMSSLETSEKMVCVMLLLTHFLAKATIFNFSHLKAH